MGILVTDIKENDKNEAKENKTKHGNGKCPFPGFNTMADVNVNAPVEQAPAMAPPTRTDDLILPRSRWVPVGKSNCYLDVEKSQSNPIYKITMDILKHTNFFRAFTASSTIPSIYIQQFWDIIRYITPVDNSNPFSSPPTPNALINFFNELGYPKVVRTLSAVVTNDMFQPWRALTTIINLCLTGKTLAFERPRAPGKKKTNPLVIPSVRFTKLIIHHLQSKHKFHSRPDSLLHLSYEEYVLGYLKFSAKGTKWEVFRMPIPNDLITDDIRGKQYYNEYLEKVAKHQRYLAGEEVSDPDSPAPKLAKATKPKATKQSKPQPPKPTLATTEPSKKDQSKKRKLVKDSSKAPSPAKRHKAGKELSEREWKEGCILDREIEGIPDNICDVPFHDNSPPLDISKDQFEEFSDSNDDSTSIDDDSFSIDDIDYVEASPPHSELVSLEEVKDFHPEDGELEDDVLREKLSKINLLIAKIEALNANPTPFSDFVLKSPIPVAVVDSSWINLQTTYRA
ncbi:hypothetical protein Tco_1057060 [Tanacetum coccineum]|uniref:Uncharacterized protein n=1 Tax=Tanacetum coccineum TaxID=301880 RepID=A0ABQ5H6E0_9ASTR